MADITPAINEVLSARGCTLITSPRFSIDQLNDFLKESYQINSRIAELLRYLRSIRQPYLSNAPPTHRAIATRHGNSAAKEKPRFYLDDEQRDQIDAEAKAVLRELHTAVRNLSQAEQVRQDAEAALAQSKRSKMGFGMLQWAQGGGALSKSPEEEAVDAKANALKLHREGIIWYLQRKLEECGSTQSRMMEARIRAAIEKSKSISWRTTGHKGSSGPVPVWDETQMGQHNSTKVNGSFVGQKGMNIDELDRSQEAHQLSEEQVQLFAMENQNMLKLYESKLDQVRTAEKSLVEISEMQSTLAINLEVQSANIEQLVQDSVLVTENVGSGNKELKKATERRSTARMVFYSTAALCTFLVLWDLVI